MKKSPLSRFQDNNTKQFSRNYRGRWQNRPNHYHNPQTHDNDSFQNYENNLEDSPMGQQSFQQVHPLETSTPMYHSNRGSPRYCQNNQRFMRGGHFRGSPYSPNNKFNHHNNSYQNVRTPRGYRNMDVSELLNFQEVMKNPWAELEREFSRTRCIEKTVDIDSSVEIISQTTIDSLNSSRDEETNDTINVSSGVEKSQESKSSSVELKIDTINFDSQSQESSTSSPDASTGNSSSIELLEDS